jgi:hypothetical protein
MSTKEAMMSSKVLPCSNHLNLYMHSFDYWVVSYDGLLNRLKLIKITKCREILHYYLNFEFRNISFLPSPKDLESVFKTLDSVTFKNKQLFVFSTLQKLNIKLVESQLKLIEDKLNLSDRTVFHATDHVRCAGVTPALFWQNIPFKMGIFTYLLRGLIFEDEIDKNINCFLEKFLSGEKTFIKNKFSGNCDIVNVISKFKEDDIVNKDGEEDTLNFKSNLIEYCSMCNNLSNEQLNSIDNFVSKWKIANLMR